MSANDADLTTSTRPKAVSTPKSNKFQNTIRNSLEKQQQQQLQQQQKQSELKQQEENTQLNDEENKLNARLKVDSQSENKIQNKDKIVNKVDDLIKDGLTKQQNNSNNSSLNSLTSTTSNNNNNNANSNNTNQNLALFLNLLKNQAWTAPGGPTSPVQQQQQQQQNLLNFSFLPLVQNNPQLQLASLFQNPLLANILNIRLNAATSPNLPSPQSLTPASSNSSNSSLDDVNDFSSSSFCQNQPINLSKIKEETLSNDAPLDLSNRKVEKRITQENFHTVNSLYSTTINRNANTFSDLNGKRKLHFIYSFSSISTICELCFNFCFKSEPKIQN